MSKPSILFMFILLGCSMGSKNYKTKRFTNLEADLTSKAATFNFNYASDMGTYHIDLSTSADMTWDVYLSFVVGSETPLIQTNPQQWDKYVAGKKLYWRVTNHARTIQSAIMPVIVKN